MPDNRKQGRKGGKTLYRNRKGELKEIKNPNFKRRGFHARHVPGTKEHKEFKKQMVSKRAAERNAAKKKNDSKNDSITVRTRHIIRCCNL